jgi:hypothetical protein
LASLSSIENKGPSRPSSLSLSQEFLSKSNSSIISYRYWCRSGVYIHQLLRTERPRIVRARWAKRHLRSPVERSLLLRSIETQIKRGKSIPDKQKPRKRCFWHTSGQPSRPSRLRMNTQFADTNLRSFRRALVRTDSAEPTSWSVCVRNPCMSLGKLALN